MKISIYLTVLSLCVLQVLSKKEETRQFGGPLDGFLGFVMTIIDFIVGSFIPMFTASDALSSLCDSAFDLIPFTEPCSCSATPSILSLSASASLTCPIFDTCPDNVGFACGNCDVVLGATGGISVLDGTLGARCTVDSPLFDFVSFEASGGVTGGTSGFGLDSCSVTAGALGASVASCACSVDPACGPFGVTYTCSVAGIELFSSGGCVALDSFGI